MAETRLTPKPAHPSALTHMTAEGWLAGLEWTLLAVALAVASLTAVGKPVAVASVASAWLLAGAWLARWRRTGQLTRATALDLPLLLFALSALAGLWAAPDTWAALGRLILFAAAVSVYYALANTSGRNLRRAALGLVVVGAVIGLAFLLGLTGDHLHRNDVAGLQAILTPVAVAVCLRQVRVWRRSADPQSALTAAVAGLAALIGVVTPLWAGSRTVVLAAVVVLVLAGWWRLAGRLRQALRAQQANVFGLGLIMALVALIALMAWQPAWVVEALRTLPGADPTTGLGRLVLFGQAWQLAQATPFTGGGLGAFPALYSTYIHDIPHFLLAHAHNNYLNLLVEQGWPGLVGFVLALLASAWVAVRGLAKPPAENRTLLAAGAAGLVMAAVHGLGDATLVATWVTPFMLVPAGLIAAAAPQTRGTRTPPRLWQALALGSSALGVMLLLLSTVRPLAAAWQANLGVVAQSRAWLRGWATGQWRDGSHAADGDPARQHYALALGLDPRNLTAHYGLGLLAREAHDFETAATHLEQALAQDSNHYGVIKVLGYTYVWLGRLDEAEPLLASVPEASREMSNYAWWWYEVGRPDLADYAAQMQLRLEQ